MTAKFYKNDKIPCGFSNHLMALPETPLGLKDLKRLDISHNQIDCIPEKFLHTCSKLETLEASFNHISKNENLTVLFYSKCKSVS